MIVPLDRSHVRDVARLHCESLTGLVSELGPSAARAFHAGCVGAGAGSARGFVAIEDGKLAGFVSGSIQPGEMRREILRRNPFGTLAGLAVGILRSPRALVSLVKSFRGPDEGSYDEGSAELTYLVVDTGFRGAGIGHRLVEAFTEAMREAGAPSYELSVDDVNSRAATFYEGLGFRLVGRYREFGIAHRRYRLDLD